MAPTRAIAQRMHERVEVTTRVSPKRGVLLQHVRRGVFRKASFSKWVKDFADGLVRTRVVRGAHRPDRLVNLVQRQHRSVVEDYWRRIERASDPGAAVGRGKLRRVNPSHFDPFPRPAQRGRLVDDRRQTVVGFFARGVSYSVRTRRLGSTQPFELLFRLVRCGAVCAACELLSLPSRSRVDVVNQVLARLGVVDVVGVVALRAKNDLVLFIRPGGVGGARPDNRAHVAPLAQAAVLGYFVLKHHPHLVLCVPDWRSTAPRRVVAGQRDSGVATVCNFAHLELQISAIVPTPPGVAHTLTSR
mmetsp:Transcript_52799/g.126663  ORF Transcript_52799/g.126663 Transcript_52799/m.126663 type:complete len:302 (-) Transcript_52799:192-1097(-)